MDNNTIDEILKIPGCWSEAGPYNDIVISTNINLGRNIYNVSFPHRQDENEISYLKSVAKKFAGESAYRDELLFIDLDRLTFNNRSLLKERGIIPEEMEEKENCLVISSVKGDYRILVNKEDHFTINVARPGLQVSDGYKSAGMVDDELNKFAPYAFCENIGYIASNPFNLGTGLKVSTILHLPVLTLNKKIIAVYEAADRNGLKLAPIIDDRKKGHGSIYILSNRTAAGISEEEIMELVYDATDKIIDIESNERDNYLIDYQSRLEDKIYRSLGILKFARLISFYEALECLSDIRLGIILSIIKGLDICTINDLMIKCQQWHLQKRANRIFTESSDCSEFRASSLKEQLEWSTVYG